MPDPNASDRERLLRLIDGGPEAVKEVQEERETTREKQPAPVVPAASKPKGSARDIFAAKEWLGRLNLDTAGLLRIVLVGVLIIFGIRSLVDQWKSPKKPDAGVSSIQGPAAEDISGTGLRLVGVDWGNPPVALLEDLKTGRTYFVHTNEKIKETRVKEIFKDKITVSFHGKTEELR